MILPTKILFDLNVYRLDQSAYLKKFQEYANQYSGTSYNPSIDDFGGIWKYNEIIEYLTFYISGGTQLRVGYHTTNAKKIVKTRTKTFILKNDSFCTRNIYKSMSNQELIDVIRECIDDCKSRLKPRYIDTSSIDTTLDYTDWNAVIF